MRAHDPPRHVGDMLAWLHSAAVGEMESLEGLFFVGEQSSIAQSIAVGREMEPWVPGSDAYTLLRSLADQNLQLVCDVLSVCPVFRFMNIAF